MKKSLLFLVIVLVAFTTFSQVNKQDSIALVKFYQSTNGSNWKTNSGWLYSPINKWHGVTIKDNRVFMINLPNNRVKGQLPKEIGDLDEIVYIYLYSNQLEGSLPAEITKLTKLQVFSIVNNKLSGELPTDIDKLANLSIFNIGDNNLTGKIPSKIKDLNNLTFFHFENNKYTFHGMEDVWSDLKQMDIDLSYSPQKTVGKEKIIYRSSGDSIILTIDDFIEGKNDVFQWYLNGKIVNNSNSLNLKINLDTSIVFGNYKCYVSNTSISGLNLESEETRVVEIGVNQQDSLSLVSLYNSTNGNNWKDNSSWVQNPVSQWIGIDIEKGRVTKIALSSNNLNGVLPSDIFNLEELVSIDLSNNQLVDSIPTGIEKLSKLEELDFSYNNMYGGISPIITDSSILHSIDLSNNEFRGIIPKNINKLDSLKELNLSNNELGGIVPTEIISLKNLSLLDISNNNFTFYDMEDAYKYLKKLKVLNISPQSVVGTTFIIHDTIGSKVKLQIQNFNSGKYDNYQWFINSDSSLGNNTNPVEFTLDTSSRFGTYICKIINDSIPNLVLESNPIDIISSHQYNSLKTIYDETKGTSWTNDSNWLNLNTSLNEWYGIKYDEGNITQINLSDNNLTGSIPTDIEDLIGLKQLDLSNNNLNGILPASLSNLRNLNKLYVNNNKYSFNEIWPIWHSIKNIKSLKYSPQDIIGVDTFILATKASVRLKINDYIANSYDKYQWYKKDKEISGAASYPYELIINSSNDLDEYYCIITNDSISGLAIRSHQLYIGESVNGLDSIALINLYDSLNGNNWKNSNNWKKSPVFSWYGVKVEHGRVVELNLQFNNLEGNLPYSIRLLTGLKNLDLSGNNISGAVIPYLSDLISLEKLNLSNNMFDHNLPIVLSNMKELKILDLSNNRLSGGFPEFIANFKNLEELNLSNNQFFGAISDTIKELRNLRNLNLALNRFEDVFPTSVFDSMIYLKELNIADNKFNGFILSKLSSLANLRSINISNNSFDGNIESSNLSALKNLELINISNNEFVGDVFSVLSKLPQLRYMNVSMNGFNGKIENNIENLQRLEYINVSNNNLEGSIPKEIKNLSHLEYFNIANNYFTGILPNNMSDLNKLYYLDISNNNFTFSDFEAILNWNNYDILKNNFKYSPQSKVGSYSIINGGIGATVELNIDGYNISKEDNYFWYKTGNSAIIGNGYPYNLSILSESDYSLYNCMITNSQFPDLTLYSYDISVEKCLSKFENNIVLMNGDTLYTTIPNASYQWFNCTTKMIISGETNEYFVPEESGSYAVITTLNECKDTSSCYNYTVSVPKENEMLGISVYPNPAIDKVTINLSKSNILIEKIEVINSNSKVINSYSKYINEIEVSMFPKGVYYIRVVTKNQSSSMFKIVKI